MKKGLLLLMALMVSICSYAASDFWQEGKRWIVDQNYPEEIVAHYAFFVEGDTLYKNRHCKIIYSQNLMINIHRQFYALGYQEGDKVYCFYGDSEKPELLYDFSLKENDIFNYAGEISCRVEKIDYVISRGKTYKRWHFEDIETHEKVGNWIEDIGSIGGPLFPFRFTGNQFSLRTCMLNYESLFFINDVKEKKAEGYLVDGRTWNYKMRDIFLDENNWPVLDTLYFSLKIEGDTIFQGVDCKKIYFTENDSTYLFAYAYEENLTTYFYFLKSMKYFCAASDTWVKGFDFNLKIGDKCSSGEYIGDIDTIEVKGIKYPRFWIGIKKNGKIDPCVPMIYSIGGEDRIWEWAPIILVTEFPQYSCVSVYDGDKCIFESSDYRKAPISTDNEDVTTDKKSAFLVDGRSWNYKQTTFDIKANDIVEKFFSLTIKGETTFRDVPCREIYHTENGKSSLYGYAYEDSAKVYFYFLKDIENFCSPSTDWELIFDFDKKETEIFNASFPAYLVAKDTIEVKGNTYQRYWIGPKLEPKFKSEIIKFYPIVHSIGGYAGLHNNTFERTGKSPSYSCESVYDGDECIFEKKDFCADAINSEYDKYLKGKRWNYSHSSYMQVFGDNKKNFSLSRHHPYSLTINGDTVVSGRSCKKIYYINKYTRYIFQLNEVSSDTLFVPNNDVVLHGYMHETKDSVSFYIEKEIFGVESPEANGQWCKMYDFTAPSGTYCDWLEELSEPGFYMLGKEDVVIGGQTYTAYLLYGDKTSSLQGTLVVIPGIGCYGLYFSTIRLGSSTFSLNFSSVYDGDNCLWNIKNQNELFDKYFGKYAAVRLGSEPMESQFDYNHNHVTHLWVWGKPQAADYEYLRTKRLAELELLDMRDADIDTLQAEAFDITLPESNASPKYIVLPKKLKHISDNALCVYPNITTYEVTGAYPSLGKDVYSRKGKTSNHIFVVPSIDNKYLILHTIDPTGGSSGPGRVPIKRLAMVDDDSIYGSSVMSKGGDTLYYVNASKGKGYAVANGMKTIAANAMENKLLENAFNIPETVDSIGNRAFNGLRIVETRSNALQYYLACYRANPPMIGMEVFDESSLVTGSHVFYVNKESISDYKNTKGWDKLYYGDIDDVSGVEEVKTAEKQSPYYYDLQGRRLINPTKGLYIHNGKKVIVR